MHKSVITLLIILCIFGCDSPTSGPRFETEQYVITGLLHENQPLTLDEPIFVGKTVDLTAGNLNELVIMDADVTITHLQSNQQWPLAFGMGQDAKGAPLVGYYDPTATLLPQQGQSYRIMAYIPQDDGSLDSVYAQTRIPEHIEFELDESVFTADTLATGWPQLVYETANTEHPLHIRVPDDQSMRMYFSFYCLEEWYNAYFTIDNLPEEKPESHEDYDDPITGQPRMVSYFSLFSGELDPVSGSYYIHDRGYKSNLLFFGRYRISVFHVDENYYRYLYKPEGYNFGGVEQGIGYFGSRSGQSIYTRVIE
jgi:hypothetical protein